VPSYGSIYVEYDPDVLTPGRLERWIAEALDERGRDTASDGTERGERGERTVRLPVRYDGADLEDAASALSMTTEDLVRAHAGARYRVYALGFTPGFPFLGELPPDLVHPRRATPRTRVPAHAVAMAGRQTGVYPLPSPGGWHLLGTALEALYDPHRDPPFLLEPGDHVTFEPSDGAPPAEPAPLDLLPGDPELPALSVVRAGLLDLIVDAGRFRAGRYGLARSGPLDARSARLANQAVGNAPGTPLLEINLHGPELEALQDVVVAFAGWGVRPEGDDGPTPTFEGFRLRAGRTLRFPPGREGARGYLAVAGGLASGAFLGSVSVDLRGRIGRALADGDVLGLAAQRTARPGFGFRPPLHVAPGGRTHVRVAPGPQATAEALEALTSGTYRVSFGDRMGLRLHGPPVPGGDVLSEATPLGGIQIASGGDPIVLLHDRGSIGGYAKPAVVLPEDLPRLAQLRPGDAVRFVRAPARARPLDVVDVGDAR
jgi:KipI family sensor histidine kinase inhibitor